MASNAWKYFKSQRLTQEWLIWSLGIGRVLIFLVWWLGWGISIYQQIRFDVKSFLNK